MGTRATVLMVPLTLSDPLSKQNSLVLTRYAKLNTHCSRIDWMWHFKVWTIDPRHMKSILATDFDCYAKGERLTFAFSTVLGLGIFNTDGDTWKSA